MISAKRLSHGEIALSIGNLIVGLIGIYAALATSALEAAAALFQGDASPSAAGLLGAIKLFGALLAIVVTGTCLFLGLLTMFALFLRSLGSRAPYRGAAILVSVQCWIAVLLTLSIYSEQGFALGLTLTLVAIIWEATGHQGLASATLFRRR